MSIGAKAVAFKEALSDAFKVYQQATVDNAKALAACLTGSGIRLVSGGTDNHMILVDLTDLDITGQAAEEALGQVGITVNKNSIPFDTKGPRVTSGIRIGSPAVTTRGMGASEMQTVGALIGEVLNHINDPKRLKSIRESVRKLCDAYPLYPA